MSSIERVRELALPVDQLVVIGSGVLDALELREAGDIDLVISPALFEMLQSDSSWQVGEKHGEPIITKGDAEAFLSWGNDGVPNFTPLYQGGITVGGVRFAHPNFVIAWKQGRGMAKDLRDIELLQNYIKAHNMPMTK